MGALTHSQLVKVIGKQRQSSFQMFAFADAAYQRMSLASVFKRIRVHCLPMIKHTLREGLSRGLTLKFSVEAE